MENIRNCCKCPEDKEHIFCGCECHKDNSITYWALGKAIVGLFDLRSDKTGRYKTTWGTKTLEGLGRCIIRLVEETKE